MLSPIKINSEELNKRVTIQKAELTKNGRGVELYEYSGENDIHGVCASIESYGAYVVNGKAEKVSEIEYRITIRYRRKLSLHDRIVYQGRIFEQVLPARDINEQHKFLQLTCREKIKKA